MATETADPGRIERDLDDTRARLGSHLNELQGRLSPGQVIDDAMAYFRGSDGAEFGRNLLENVRTNPLPAAITGIGLAWLMASNTRATTSGSASKSTGSWDDFDFRLRVAESGVVRQPNEDVQRYNSRLTDARGQAAGISRQTDDTDQSFSDRVNGVLSKGQNAAADGAHGLRSKASDAVGAIGSAAGSAGSMAQSAAKRAGSALSQGGQSASQAGGNLVSALMENPMLLGALGLAAGALLGSLLPQSENEEDLLGGVAEQARTKVHGLADMAMDRGGNVAQAVLEAGKDSAGEHGLTESKSVGGFVDAALSGDLAANAKNVAQDVMKAGEKAVHENGLGQGGKS